MKLKILLSIFFSLIIITSNAQTKVLTKQQVKEDIDTLKKILNNKSSYVYLNGYDFNKDFENYKRTINDSIRLEDFGLFLTKTIGKIGDRHSSVRKYEVRDSLFLPFVYAPDGNKVIVLTRNKDKKLEILNPKFPYLKNIDRFSTEDFLLKIHPKEISAPKKSYFTMAVREIRDIQKNYKILGKPLPKEIRLTLSDPSFKNDTFLVLSPVGRKQTLRPWDEKFESDYLLVKDDDYNKVEIVNKLFNVKDKIGYIRLPAMASKEDAPLLFDKIKSFMKSIQNDSRALIIDVRSNGGGTRDLTYELAKYFIHPDSVYVVNAAYSEYYFGLLNGKKLANQSFYYDKPVYILANEKSFSAASVFVAVFKGIPNVKIVGVTTDGSSGNSDRFELPNSAIRIKLSTMISFQKDGKILDGFGTEPDIKIERDLQQILWKSDTQLDKLRSFILKD